MKKYFRIDPLKSFIELPILWIVVVFLFLLAAVISIVIVCNSNLVFSPDFNGFNSFVIIFKVPLAILAIIVTYSAFIATIHRSVQIREQIITTNKQNTFSNYFKHIEEFEKYINNSIDNKLVHFQNLRSTHKYLFPKSLNGDFSVNEEFLRIIENEYSKCKGLIDKFNRIEEKPLFEIFYEIFSNIDKIFSLIDCKVTRSGRQFVKDGKKIVVPELRLKGAFSVIKNNSIILEQILSFDHNIIIPKSLQLISKLNTTVVPYWSLELKGEIEKFDVFA